MPPWSPSYNEVCMALKGVPGALMVVTGTRRQGPRRTISGLTRGGTLERQPPPHELSPSPPPGVYSFGLFTTTIFANAGQVVTGNPTPHFLSVCRPNYTALGCPPPSPDRPGPDRFVTDQGACAGSPSLVAAARRAFPCKDAALCAYAVTYTAVSPEMGMWQCGVATWAEPSVPSPGEATPQLSNSSRPWSHP